MTRKTQQSLLILAALSLTACAQLDRWGAANTYSEDTNAVTLTETQLVPVAQAAPVATPPCADEAPSSPVIIPPTEDSNEFINFRETNSNYREFGERTPRDQRIVTAAAGSNMSASIPPTIEEEVMDYEDEVNAALNDAEEGGSSDNGSNALGDDPVEDWLAEEGNTLKGLLSDWSERAGWRLIWNTNRNYTLAAGAMFRGRFADVSSALIRTFARARPAPLATFYKGNRVLVVETMEDENAYN